MADYVDEKCEVDMLSQGDVFAYVGKGHLTVEMVQWLCRRFDEFAVGRRGPFLVFADFYAVRSYDTNARIEATRWFKANLPRFEGYHVAVASKLLRMGLSTMALLSGLHIRTYENVPSFERALGEAARQRRSTARPAEAAAQR